MATVQPIQRVRAQAVSLHTHAVDNLRFIRETMERAGSFTAVPGWGGFAIGLSALLAAAVASRQATIEGWLTTWLVEGVVAIAIGALVPAAIMSIAAANLFTRNVYREFINPKCGHADEAKVAKLVSLVVKLGALGFIIFLDPKFSIDFQLLGGCWILQTFPTIVFGLFAFALNLVLALVLTPIFDALGLARGSDKTEPHHYNLVEGA